MKGPQASRPETGPADSPAAFLCARRRPAAEAGPGRLAFCGGSACEPLRNVLDNRSNIKGGHRIRCVHIYIYIYVNTYRDSIKGPWWLYVGCLLLAFLLFNFLGFSSLYDIEVNSLSFRRGSEVGEDT